MSEIALDILHCEIGTVSSRADHSATVRIITPELRPSEAGALLGWHGKAARVCIFPDDGDALETIKVTTERDQKTPSQRLHAIVHVHWKQQGGEGDFETFYRQQMERIINGYKEKNLRPL